MRLFLGSLIHTIPSAPSWNLTNSGAIPPLTITPSGAEIDYYLLLFASQLVVDEEALSFLLSHSNPTLNAIGTSAKVLQNEGLLQTTNFRLATAKFTNDIEEAARLAADAPEYWISGIRSHIRRFREIRPELAQLVHNKMTVWDDQTYSIANHLIRKDRMSDHEAKRLTNLILEKDPERMTADEIADLKEVIAETIRVVSGQMLLAEDSNSHIYSWQTYNHLFDMLAKFRPTATTPIQNHLENCQNFFEIAYSEFAPKTQSAWLKILLDKDVSALRQKIADTTRSGARIDKGFPQKEMNQLLARFGAVGRRRKWIGRGINFGAAIVGGLTTVETSSSLLIGIMAGFGVSGIGMAANELADGAANKKVKKDFRWMYFMPNFPVI